jgi:hypothetical protein
MILADTSVLIDYLKNTQNEKTSLFQTILERKIPFGITELIYLEVLQGAKNEKEWYLLRDYLQTMVFYHLQDETTSYENASKLHFTCRKVGVTVRSTIDLIIAQTAIENKLSLLHNDNDFDNMASVITDLKICNRTDFS